MTKRGHFSDKYSIASGLYLICEAFNEHCGNKQTHASLPINIGCFNYNVMVVTLVAGTFNGLF